MNRLKRWIALPDVRITLALTLLAAGIGMVYVGSWGRTPSFYQEIFGPAVLFACGHGFQNPVLEAGSALDQFLHPAMHGDHPPEMDAFPCSALPDTLAVQPMFPLQHRHIYLLIASGLVWAVCGVAWSALVPIYGALYGAMAAALYGLFRLGMNRWISVLCTAVMILSPVQLNNLVRLRDFSKAPFILAAILLTALLIKAPRRLSLLLLASLGCGAIIRVGEGFRMDVLVCLPAFVLTMLAFTPHGLRRRLPARVAALLLFAASYIASGWFVTPVLDTSMKYHHFLLGLNELYDERLGVGDAPYQVAHRYLDREPMAMFQAFAKHQYGETRHYEFDTEAFEEVGREYTRHLLKTFPADMVMRAYAAVLRTVDELHVNPAQPAPREVTNAFLLSFYKDYGKAMSLALRYARYAVLATLLLLSACSLRYGFAGLLFLLYFLGYGAIQYASRHYFHLEFVSLWAVAFLVQGILTGLAWLRAPKKPEADDTKPARVPLQPFRIAGRVLLFSAITIPLLAAPLVGLRAYQERQVHDLLSEYLAAQKQGFPYESTARPDGNVLLRGVNAAGGIELPADESTPYFEVEFLRLEVAPGEAPFKGMLQYEGAVQDLALDWEISLPAWEGGPAVVFFPVYYARWKGEGAGWTRFTGITLSEAARARVRSFQRVEHPEQFPLLITASLLPGWEERPLYQKLDR